MPFIPTKQAYGAVYIKFLLMPDDIQSYCRHIQNWRGIINRDALFCLLGENTLAFWLGEASDICRHATRGMLAAGQKAESFIKEERLCLLKKRQLYRFMSLALSLCFMALPVRP
jgi:hypothetical protein